MKSKSKSKSDSSNSTPLKMNSLNNGMKEKKILIDRILDKLNENKLYTVAIAIFLEIKANNYEPTSTKIINQKIISDFITHKKQFLKNEKESGFYDLESQVQKAIVAVLTATNVFTKYKKGNINYVKFDFFEAEEYLKKIKNRKISSLIKNELENFNKIKNKNINKNNIKIKNNIKNNNNTNNSNSNNNKVINDKNINKDKETKENKDNKIHKSNKNNSKDIQDEEDDFSISIDSNFVGGEEKKLLGNKRENSFDEEENNIMNNNDSNINNNLNNSFNDNNTGINLNGGIKKRKYNKQKKGLIGENKKKLKNLKNPNSDSDSEEVKMLENYDIIHDNNQNNQIQKKIIKHRKPIKKKKIMKNNLEIDIQRIRGRPRKKLNIIPGNYFFKNKINYNVGDRQKKIFPFISISNKNKFFEGKKNFINQNNNKTDKIIEIVEESSEEIKSRQINNYLEHLYSFNKIMNEENITPNICISGNIDDNKSQNGNNNKNLNDESIKNISDKSLHIISKIKVLYDQMDKMEDNLDLLNNLFNQSPSSSTYNESETSPHKKNIIINDNMKSISNNNIFIENNNKINGSKSEKLYKEMKNNENFLNACYNNIELNIKTLNNINKLSNWNNNEQLVNSHKKLIKDYEQKYDEALEAFTNNLNEINELAFNNNALKIYENIKEIKDNLKKEKIAIGSLDDFFKKLGNNFENEKNKFFDVENIKQMYIEKKSKLLNSISEK